MWPTSRLVRARRDSTLLSSSHRTTPIRTAPAKINTDPQGKDQYYPWMSVLPNGQIWVGWNDRRDDPNDIFAHEDRRELRGLRVFCAWLNHDDSRGINSLDMLETADGRGWVKHYMFDFGSISEETVGEWIDLCKALGFNQIDFHGGGSFRFGDCRPDPATYPKGFEDLKAAPMEPLRS